MAGNNTHVPLFFNARRKELEGSVRNAKQLIQQ
jgi:hypothetical protein